MQQETKSMDKQKQNNYSFPIREEDDAIISYCRN